MNVVRTANILHYDCITILKIINTPYLTKMSKTHSSPIFAPPVY